MFTSYDTFNNKGLLKLYYSVSVLSFCQMKDQNFIDGRDTMPVLMRYFVFSPIYFVEENFFCHALITKANGATMTGACGSHTGNERCTDMTAVTIEGLENMGKPL